MWAAHVGYRGQETDYMQRRYFMQDDLEKMVGNHVLTGDVSLWSMFHSERGAAKSGSKLS